MRFRRIPDFFLHSRRHLSPCGPKYSSSFSSLSLSCTSVILPSLRLRSACYAHGNKTGAQAVHRGQAGVSSVRLRTCLERLAAAYRRLDWARDEAIEAASRHEDDEASQSLATNRLEHGALGGPPFLQRASNSEGVRRTYGRRKPLPTSERGVCSSMTWVNKATGVSNEMCPDRAQPRFDTSTAQSRQSECQGRGFSTNGELVPLFISGLANHELQGLTLTLAEFDPAQPVLRTETFTGGTALSRGTDERLGGHFHAEHRGTNGRESRGVELDDWPLHRTEHRAGRAGRGAAVNTSAVKANDVRGNPPSLVLLRLRLLAVHDLRDPVRAVHPLSRSVHPLQLCDVSHGVAVDPLERAVLEGEAQIERDLPRQLGVQLQQRDAVHERHGSSTRALVVVDDPPQKGVVKAEDALAVRLRRVLGHAQDLVDGVAQLPAVIAQLVPYHDLLLLATLDQEERVPGEARVLALVVVDAHPLQQRGHPIRLAMPPERAHALQQAEDQEAGGAGPAGEAADAETLPVRELPAQAPASAVFAKVATRLAEDEVRRPPVEAVLQRVEAHVRVGRVAGLAIWHEEHQILLGDPQRQRLARAARVLALDVRLEEVVQVRVVRGVGHARRKHVRPAHEGRDELVIRQRAGIRRRDVVDDPHPLPQHRR
eukprot:scaffold407_cov251-Pinguiococcus_pyrenoidosus.AAC.19